MNLRFKFESKRLNDFGRLTFNHLLSVEVMIEFYLNVARIKDKNSFFMYSMMTVSKTIYDLPENLFPPILRVSGENT